MKETTKQSLNQDLENLEKKILKIALSDPEKYSEFYSRLTDIQTRFIGLSELELDIKKADIIGSISILDDDFSAYMDGYDHEPASSLNFDKPIESGRAKLKNYRFNIYSSIFRDFEKLDYIKLEQLSKLKSQWDIDKVSQDYQFSPIEISAMEQRFSDAFLEYQLKALKIKGVFPTEKITDFVSLEEYQASIQRRLGKELESPDISALDKLELDTLRTKNNLKEILGSPILFQTLAGRKHTLSQGEIRELIGEEPKNKETVPQTQPPASSIQENTSLVTANKYKKSSKHMICIVEVPNKFFNRGKVHYKEIKVKLNNPNELEIPLDYKDRIVSVILPEGTTVIPPKTFEGCKRLTEAILPSTLKYIGKDAFNGLYNLQRVNLPEGLETIDDYAFWNCYNLNSVKFPESLKKIGHYSYINCSKLKEIKLPSKLEQLGEGAFEGCIELQKFDCSPNLEIIPPSLLKGCKNLSEIKFSKNLITIGRSAFEECRKLTSLTNLPNTLERIEDSAFHRCERLGIIDLPDSLRHLGAGALSLITDLKHLTLPGIMDYIGQGALTNNPNLTEVIMPHTLENAFDILYKKFNPDLKLLIPENPRGAFYKKLGINEKTKLSTKDFKDKYQNSIKQISETDLETSKQSGEPNSPSL